MLHTKDHISKHTPIEHLKAFYKTYDEIRDRKFDGMIITGAPRFDQYVYINAYGNLESISEYEYKEILNNNRKEIIERYNELEELKKEEGK